MKSETRKVQRPSGTEHFIINLPTTRVDAGDRGRIGSSGGRGN